MEANAPVSAGPDPKSPLQLIYILQAIAWFVAPLWLVTAVLIHLKRDEVHGTWLAAHYRWQWRTVWFGLLWYVLMLPLMVFWPLFWAAAAINSLWLGYRVIRGWWRLSEEREPY